MTTTAAKSSQENDNIISALKRVVAKIDNSINNSGTRAGNQDCDWFDTRLEDLLAVLSKMDPDNITDEQKTNALKIELDIFATTIGACNSAQKAELLEDKNELETIICKLEGPLQCRTLTNTFSHYI